MQNSLNAIVTVHDSDKSKLLKAANQGFRTERDLINGVDGKFLIIGATGETSVDREAILSVDHNAYLVSASSEQWEFSILELEALSSRKTDITDSNEVKVGTRYEIKGTDKYVNLLADGYPINFWGTESLPNQVSDLIVSLLFISTIGLVRDELSSPKIDTELTNKMAKEFEMSQVYMEIHR